MVNTVVGEASVAWRSVIDQPFTTLTLMMSTSDLYDQRGEELQAVSRQFIDFGGRTAFSGPMRTVRCLNDNVLVRQALASPGEGAVLVVDGGSSLECALVGDGLLGMGLENGWVGIVLFAAVRDRLALAQLDFGVKALGVNPRSSGKTGEGESDSVLVVDGVTFTPGKHIWADLDGVLVER